MQMERARVGSLVEGVTQAIARDKRDRCIVVEGRVLQGNVGTAWATAAVVRGPLSPTRGLPAFRAARRVASTQARGDFPQ